MAKNPKKSKEVKAPESPAPVPGMESSNGHGTAKSAPPAVAKTKPAKATAQSRSTLKGRGTTRRKSTAPREAWAKKAPERTSQPTVTDEQIRLRAYFISEWRMKRGMPGDSAHDWLEARRQLQAEADRP